MTKQDRGTLKRYFESGTRPLEQHFADLIDSMLNMADEGFDKSAEEGIKVNQLSEEGKLATFFKDYEMTNPLFSMRVDRRDNLVFGAEKQGDVLFLPVETASGQKVKVGINIEEPERELDVDGVIKAVGRVGDFGRAANSELKVKANGQWHYVTPPLYGCQAFEVMAGVGGKAGEGKYALVHAFALNAYNPKGWLFNIFNFKNRIRYHHAYYRSRSDQLKLRWHEMESADEGGQRPSYGLQIKSGNDYGEGTNIKYYITQLWFDERMDESRPSTH